MTLPPQLQGRLRAPRRGKIKLGVMVDNRSGHGQHPQEVEYFVLPEELRPHFAHLPGGEKPTSLSIMFPFATVERNLVVAYKRYQGAGEGKPGILTLSCDGCRFIEWPLPAQRGAALPPPREGVCCRPVAGEAPDTDRRRSFDWPDALLDQIDAGGTCGAEAKAGLSIILLDGPLGVYQIWLGGETRITDLWADLEVHQRTFGSLAGIVFELRREEVSVRVRDEETHTTLQKMGWPVRCYVAASTRQAIEFSGRKVSELPGGHVTAPAALPPASAGHIERPGESAPQPELEPDDWDISMCFAHAQRDLGVTVAEYTRYLEGKYRHDVDNLTSEEIGEQERMLRHAASDPTKRATMAKLISKGRV